MKSINTLLFTLMVCSTATVQAATLELPGSLNLLAVNGSRNDDKAVLENLPVGKQQIVVQYAKNLKNGSKMEHFISKPYVLELEISNPDDFYKLSHKHMRSYKVAESAFESGKIEWKLTKNGSVQNNEPEELIPSDGFLPYANIEKAVRYHNKEKGIILTSAGAKNITDAVVTVDKETGKAEISGDPVTQLKLWYTKASKEEQKAFRRWLIDQE